MYRVLKVNREVVEDTGEIISRRGILKITH